MPLDINPFENLHFADDDPAPIVVQSDPPPPIAMPRTAVPRPGIWHLMVWTAASGACVAWGANLLRSHALEAPAWLVALIGINAVPIGGTFLFLWLLAARLIRREHWPIEPGTWLAAISGVTAIAEMLVGNMTGLVRAASMVWALRCCLWTIPLLARSTPRRWRVVFALLALGAAPIAQMAFVLFGEPFTFGVVVIALYLAGPISLLVAALIDLRVRPRLSWLHWTGIALVLAMAALRMAPAAISLVVRQP